MIKHEQGEIQYYTFSTLNKPGIFHGVFTRLGGESPPPWNSLNTGGTVGDDRAIVSSNLKRILAASSTSYFKLAQVRQVHSSDVILVDAPTDGEFKGDAMISNKPGICLLMRFADCVPILFYDEQRKAVGIAHAGWKGTVKDIGARVVKKMGDAFGSKPAELLVGIGPSIGPDHYVVGDDVIEEVKKTFPERWGEIIHSDFNEVKLDLWKANELSLRRVGIQNIEQSGICTACHTGEWFSHRAEMGRTGRFAALLYLAD